MFLTSILAVRICRAPQVLAHTKTPAGSSRGASGGGGLYSINFSARFTLCNSPYRVSQRQAAATQIRRACPHEPTQSNETPHGNTSSDNHQPASPQ